MPSAPDNARDSFRAVIRMTGIVVLWLAAGAVVNVLVAWGAKALPAVVTSTESVFSCPWPIQVPPSWPARGNGRLHHYTGWDDLNFAGGA